MKAKTKAIKVNPKKMSVAVPKVRASYDKDFFKWTQAQAGFLKRHNLDKLDLAHLAEEIESLGKSDKRSLRSQLRNLMLHLLKVKYQKKKTRSWTLSINNAKEEIEYILDDSPSLKRELLTLMQEAYPRARQDASVETKIDLKNFPKECPWTVENILTSPE